MDLSTTYKMTTAKQTQQQEVANWLRWAIGIGVTILIALVVHIGNEGSALKHEQSGIKAIQAEHSTRLQDMEKQQDRMEKKQDYIILKIDNINEKIK